MSAIRPPPRDPGAQEAAPRRGLHVPSPPLIEDQERATSEMDLNTTTEEETPDWSLDVAINILDTIAKDSEFINEAFDQREDLLKYHQELAINDAPANAQQAQAAIDHLRATIETLRVELDCERRVKGGMTQDLAGRDVGLTLSLPRVEKKPNVLSSHLVKSPLAIKMTSSSRDSDGWCNVLGRQTETRLLRNRGAGSSSPASHPGKSVRDETELQTMSTSVQHISNREEKIRETLREKDYWQQEYKLMREQVVEEKLRQVDLFHRLEQQRREQLGQNDDLDRALREAQVENQLLKSQLSEARIKIVHQSKAAEQLVRQAKEEKERLVCSIAETRQKFKEWKDGEAATLKAARDQAVHTLKTEYELKIARHHQEKQKLRDKVKDLEVSLRLLQRDRNLSPQELSMRKAAILGGRDGGITAEAELIEAHCRIKELEALLNHAKEYQKRQENIIKVSESTIARLAQEREVVSLEQATLLQPLVALAALGGVGANTNESTPTETTAKVSKLTGSPQCRASRDAEGIPDSHVTKSPRVPSSSGGIMGIHLPETNHTSSHSTHDPDKEILRRQSLVLTAEVEKYRHLVVQSMDEIRVLRDNRRRSNAMLNAGNSDSGGEMTTMREQFLLAELLKVQNELEAMKAKYEKSEKKNEEKQFPVPIEKPDSKSPAQGDEDECNSDSSSDSEDGENPENAPVATMTSSVEQVTDNSLEKSGEEKSTELTTSDEENSEHRDSAVSVIQGRSKTFLLRKAFVKKRQAVDKIKAQYRGYLVRKNIELVDRSQRSLVVTYPMQVKMQIVQPHHIMETVCHSLPLSLVIRVSKDPSVVQIKMDQVDQDTSSDDETPQLTSLFTTPTSSSTPVPRLPDVFYFHLFEIVALLPLDDETHVLEQLSESEIARLLGSLLEVVMVDGDYRFRITRRATKQNQKSMPYPLMAPAITGSYLTRLRVHEEDKVDAGEDTVPPLTDSSRSLLTDPPMYRTRKSRVEFPSSFLAASECKASAPIDKEDLDALIEQSRFSHAEVGAP